MSRRCLRCGWGLIVQALGTMKAGTVAIHEDEDFDRRFLIGTFRADWTSGEAHEVGPEGVDLATALSWARAKSSRVVVWFGDQAYNAGPVLFGDFPPLPVDVRSPGPRRNPTFAYLDRQPGDPPVRWPVELDFHLEREPLGGAARAFVDSIAEHPAVIALEADPVATERTVRATFSLTARTYSEVNELADAILKGAMEAALQAIPAGASSGWYAGQSVNAPAGPA
jgi:hypothetical protein